MRRLILTYILICFIGIEFAQAQTTLPMGNTMIDRYGNQIDPSRQPDNLEDSTNTEIVSPPPKLYMWTVSGDLGNQNRIPVDTATLNFQNSNLGEGMGGHYNYLGNLGAARISRLFFERGSQEPTIFIEPLSCFYVRPDQVKFTNSNIPFTNLTYYKAGSKQNGEERFKSYFSVNVNKRLAFGFNTDYIYGRGYYTSQATSYFNAGLFASYIGKRYQMHVAYNNFFFKMNENGGITDDRYITNPESLSEGTTSYDPSSIPVALENTSNRNHDFFIYLTHRYRLGFERKDIKIVEKNTGAVTDAVAPAPAPAAGSDSLALPPAALAQDTIVTEEFVPVTSFIHTFKVERSSHRFRAGTEPGNYYANTYYQPGFSNDTTVALSVKNVVGIALLEGFNKYAKAGLTAYVSHKINRYTMMGDSLMPTDRRQYTEQEVYAGGELAKREGNTLHYRVQGEAGLAGEALGQFRVTGDADLNFRLWKDTVNFYVRGHITNTLPSFYMRHYHSNHFYWDNDDMSKEFRTRIESELNIKRWGTNLRAGIENIKNYTYFDQYALPAQCGGSIQVIDATLQQNFRAGIFHLDNEVTWQQSGNQDLLPLPKLTLYHNLYIYAKLFNVLTVQLGADVRYFSKYYAPGYTPAIQQFNLQPAENRVEIGGYPIVNVYANLQLKRTRLFAMMYHVNAGMGNRNYFLVPHYPLNRRLIKLGISWNFYD